jgi:hypothetical protein
MSESASFQSVGNLEKFDLPLRDRRDSDQSRSCDWQGRGFVGCLKVFTSTQRYIAGLPGTDLV